MKNSIRLVFALALTCTSATAFQATFNPLGGGQAWGMGSDGSAVAGADSQGAFLWTVAGGYQALGATGGVGVSDDGTTLLGDMISGGQSVAGIWKNGSWTSLGGIGGSSGSSTSTAYGLSGSGNAAPFGSRPGRSKLRFWLWRWRLRHCPGACYENLRHRRFPHCWQSRLLSCLVLQILY